MTYGGRNVHIAREGGSLRIVAGPPGVWEGTTGRDALVYAMGGASAAAIGFFVLLIVGLVSVCPPPAVCTGDDAPLPLLLGLVIFFGGLAFGGLYWIGCGLAAAFGEEVVVAHAGFLEHHRRWAGRRWIVRSYPSRGIRSAEVGRDAGAEWLELTVEEETLRWLVGSPPGVLGPVREEIGELLSRPMPPEDRPERLTLVEQGGVSVLTDRGAAWIPLLHTLVAVAPFLGFALAMFGLGAPLGSFGDPLGGAVIGAFVLVPLFGMWWMFGPGARAIEVGREALVVRRGIFRKALRASTRPVVRHRKGDLVAFQGKDRLALGLRRLRPEEREWALGQIEALLDRHYRGT